MTHEELFVAIDKIAREQSEKFGQPAPYYYNIGVEKAEMLAKNTGADVWLCKIGAILMDIKLGDCMANKCVPEHIQKSAEFAEKILTELEVDEKTKQILLDCVKCHHGIKDKTYPCIEAEVVANADCYRFLTFAGTYGNILFANSLGLDQNQNIDFCINKIEEKFSVLSLKKAKDDLTENYIKLKKFLNSCKI